MDATFNLNLAYKGRPVIWGSLQDTTGLTRVYQAAPFLVASQPPKRYVYDTAGRLSQVVFGDGRKTIFNYDTEGNRTSVVTS